MGRAPCCEKVGLKRGAWSADEDEKLVAYIRQNGHPNWRALPKQAGLLRCGKSCRLRWINYLRPDIKRGNFTPEEEDLIIRLHLSLGNRWSAIAAQLPGRTDNEIKNIWHTHLKKKLTDRKDDRPYKSSGVTAKAIERDQSGASPGRSSSSVVCSTVTESATAVSSADYAPTTSAAATPASPEFFKEDSFSSAEFPVIDENFWSLSDVTGMMDGEDLSLRGSSRSDDMEFWLNLLQEAGDMRDLTVL